MTRFTVYLFCDFFFGLAVSVYGEGIDDRSYVFQNISNSDSLKTNNTYVERSYFK